MKKVNNQYRVKSLQWYDSLYNGQFNGHISFDDGNTFFRDMQRYCGQIVTVRETFKDGTFTVDEDGGCYRWTEEMMEDEFLPANIYDILKHAKKGYVLYCPLYGGKVKLENVNEDKTITVLTSDGEEATFNEYGQVTFNGKVIGTQPCLFPDSKTNTWENFLGFHRSERYEEAEYYFIDQYGTIQGTVDKTTERDILRYEAFNYFFTRAEAFRSDIYQAYHKLHY
jgi:hypothetical protein